MKMSVITLSLLLSLSLLIYTANAFDITQILNKYPEFSTFNSYLTQTNLATTINSRQTITLLVVDNGNISPLSSKSLDTIKNIISVHVVLDYYDVTKLQQLSSSSALLTTLFQSTGLAKGQQGFLNVTHPNANSIAFRSAMPDSTQGSSLVKLVASEPYNISILQISNAIIPQGIDGTKTSSPPTKAPLATTVTPPPPTATAPPQSSKAPTPSIAPPKPSKAPTSAPPTKAAAPTKAATPSAAPGAPASSPAAVDAPTSSEEPAETTPAADHKPKAKSAATALEIGLAVVGTMALSTVY